MNYFEEIEALVKKYIDLKNIELSSVITVPPKEEFGHFSIPCFRIIKNLKYKPEFIAEQLMKEQNNDVFIKIECVNYYLNFHIDTTHKVRNVISKLLNDEVENNKEKVEVNAESVLISSYRTIEEPMDLECLYFDTFIKYLERSLKKKKNNCVKMKLNTMGWQDINTKSDDFLKILEDFKNRTEISKFNKSKIITMEDYNMAPLIIISASGKVTYDFKLLQSLISLEKYASMKKHVLVSKKTDASSCKRIFNILDNIDTWNLENENLKLGTLKCNWKNEIGITKPNENVDKLKKYYLEIIIARLNGNLYDKETLDEIALNMIRFYLLNKKREEDIFVDTINIIENEFETIWNVIYSYMKIKEFDISIEFKENITKLELKNKKIVSNLLTLSSNYTKVINESITILESNILTNEIIDIINEYNNLIRYYDSQNDLSIEDEDEMRLFIFFTKTILNNYFEVLGLN